VTGEVLALSGWVASALVGVGARRAAAARMEHAVRASHELRGPITAARLGIALAGRPGQETAAAMRIVELELERAAVALDDLAGVGRAGLGRAGISRAGLGRGGFGRAGTGRAGVSAVRSVPLDVGELTARCVDCARGDALARGAELRLTPPGESIRVDGDPVRLSQAIRNLLANALEHGCGGAERRCGGTRPVVEVAVCASSHRVRVEVADEGPGLPAPVADLARRARGGRGTRGRGLAIAMGIAAAHGGRLAAAPTERGARLVLELPAGRPDLGSSATG
jgi:signal transduction histidine kinase